MLSNIYTPCVVIISYWQYWSQEGPIAKLFKDVHT